MSRDKISDEIRQERADEALEEYHFDGNSVADVEKWNKDGDVWSCKVYLDDIDHDDTVPASFTVWFEGNDIVDKAMQYL